MANIKGVHHIALNASDFDKTIAFYTEGLGLKLFRAWSNPEKRIAMVQLEEGPCLEIFSNAAPRTMVDTEAGNYIHLALLVEDVQAAFDRALAFGAEVKIAPKKVTLPSEPPMNVELCFVKGPDGEEIEFFKPLD